MKYITTLAAIVAFAMVSPQVAAQSGGFNVKNVNASNSVTVGTASKSVVLSSELISLPPLTNSEIALLVAPTEGSLVYASDSDVLLIFNGEWWKRIDGQNDNYLQPCESTFYDIDGNSFQGVQIGDQCWMSENLKVTTFPNGEAIRLITTTSSWIALEDTNSDVAYCYYDNDVANIDIYGNLYTYAAAIAYNWTKDNNEGQGICPEGWHLPTDAEWKILEGTVDTQYPVGDSEWDNLNWRGYDVGTHLKSTTGWVINNGDNNSGFTALPGGFRYYYDGAFYDAGYNGNWWSATENSSNYAWSRGLYYNNAHVFRYNYNKSDGFSVRCLRD